MKKTLPILIIALVLIGAIGATIWFVSQNTSASKANNKNSKPAAAIQSPLLTAPPGAEPPWVRGPSTAPVTLEEFSDFQCPACGGEFPILHDMKTAYGEQIRIVFRQYPLTQIHQKAIEAARAAEAAGVQGKFWEMHDIIYTKQKEWTVATTDPREIFAGYAQTLGLNVERFKTDSLSPMVNTRISSDLKRGDSIPIRSTPTVFLNGRMLGTDELTADGLRKAIDAAIQEKSGNANK